MTAMEEIHLPQKTKEELTEINSTEPAELRLIMARVYSS